MVRTSLSWPVFRQLTGSDRLGRGKAVRSRGTEALTSRTETADRVEESLRAAATDMISTAAPWFT